MTHDERPVVMIVDDSPEIIEIFRSILSPTYSLKIATNGPVALKIATAAPPDLILLDVTMSGMDGYDVCRHLKETEATRHVPVIFVSANDGVEAESRGFAAGAADYITKPISAPTVLARVRTHLALYRQQRFLASQVQERTLALEDSNRQLEESRIAIITRLGRAAEYRDNETGMHVIRVGKASRMLALAAGFSEQLADLLGYASMMHDVGKIGIPDAVLLKPGKLTPEEFEEIKAHSRIGAEIIGIHDVLLLNMAREVALTHHEKWDGTGYPSGLTGEDIPISGRIVAIVDVFDALISRRPYKEPWPVDKAFGLIEEGAGKHFDPTLARLFLERRAEILQIADTYSDDHDQLEATPA